MPKRLKSRKLWAAITALLYTITALYKPELQPLIPDVITIVTIYIGVQGAVDIVDTYNPKK